MRTRKNLPLIAVGCSLLFATGTLAADQKDAQTQKQMDQQKQEYSQQNQQQKQQQASQQKQGQNQYAQNLITPDKINGMKIQNKQGEEIGSVDKVVLDGEQGQIAYVVVTSGGFWGIGGEKAVIPWKAVKLQQQGQQQQQQGQQQQQDQQQQFQGEPVLVVDVTKDQLKNAPQGDLQKTLDRNQAEQIHQYYGVSPYWEGQTGQSGQQKQNQQPQMQNQQKQQKQQMENQQQKQQQQK